MSKIFEITPAMVDGFIDECLIESDSGIDVRKEHVLSAFGRWLTLRFDRRHGLGISRKNGDAGRLHQAVRTRFGLLDEEAINDAGHRVFPGIELQCGFDQQD